MHLPTEGIQKSLYLMKIMQETIKLVCGLWNLPIHGIIENLRKIKVLVMSKITMLICNEFFLKSYYNYMNLCIK